MYHQEAPRIFFIALSISTIIASVSARTTARQYMNLTQIINDKVDCSKKRDIIDECGLQQGFSFRHTEFSYPLDQNKLMRDCKRQAEAFKCLKLYSKCLPPLSKQILLAMINTRIRYNKKMCTEKPSEYSQRFLEMNNCMLKSGLGTDKGSKAEFASVSVSESIVVAKVDSLPDRLKYSCCSVAQVKKDYMESTRPQCAQYSHTFGELIDSYLSETVGIICPGFDSGMKDCDKLAKLPQVKQTNAKFFVLPIIDAINLLT